MRIQSVPSGSLQTGFLHKLSINFSRKLLHHVINYFAVINIMSEINWKPNLSLCFTKYVSKTYWGVEV
jgi:hypothetical protein